MTNINEPLFYDMIIIGGGPTGILCALECQNAGLTHLILEKGVIANSLYHFPDKMTFFSTSERLEIGGVPFLSHNPRPTRDEALEYYRRLVLDNELNMHTFETVNNILKEEDEGFKVDTDKSSYHSNSVVIATGYYSQPNLMHVEGEERVKVSHYYKNPHPYIGKELLIVGAANSACDAALECWQKGANVTMAVRGDAINERVKYWIKPNIENRIKEGSIKAYFNTEVLEIGKDTVLLDGPNGQQEILNDFVLALTGYHPDYQFIKRAGVSIKDNAIALPVCDEENLESNVPGLYLAGVINCGLETHRLFIENTRDHGEKIVKHYLLQHSII